MPSDSRTFARTGATEAYATKKGETKRNKTTQQTADITTPPPLSSGGLLGQTIHLNNCSTLCMLLCPVRCQCPRLPTHILKSEVPGNRPSVTNISRNLRLPSLIHLVERILGKLSKRGRWLSAEGPAATAVVLQLLQTSLKFLQLLMYLLWHVGGV